MKQNKNYRIDGRIGRILRPYYQIKKIESTIKFDWPEDDFAITIKIEKNYKYKRFYIALDCYSIHTGAFMEEFGVSVEGWDTWKETVDIFINLVKDNFWRDAERDANA